MLTSFLTCKAAASFSGYTVSPRAIKAHLLACLGVISSLLCLRPCPPRAHLRRCALLHIPHALIPVVGRHGIFILPLQILTLEPSLVLRSHACPNVLDRHICVANCGDSRAVMLRGDGVVPLTDDHKPDREDEKDRVEAAGGQILYWNGRRVMGVLAMSRAIGDQSLQPYIIPDPEITILHRREDDELIIMGSDGIWDVLSNEETCQLAKRALARAGSKGANARAAAKVAATVLIRAALAKGSRDNVTVIVVDLRPPDEDMCASGRASSGKVLTSAEPAHAVCGGAVRGASPRSSRRPSDDEAT